MEDDALHHSVTSAILVNASSFFAAAAVVSLIFVRRVA